MAPEQTSLPNPAPATTYPYSHPYQAPHSSPHVDVWTILVHHSLLSGTRAGGTRSDVPFFRVHQTSCIVQHVDAWTILVHHSLLWHPSRRFLTPIGNGVHPSSPLLWHPELGRHCRLLTPYQALHASFHVDAWTILVHSLLRHPGSLERRTRLLTPYQAYCQFTTPVAWALCPSSHTPIRMGSIPVHQLLWLFWSDVPSSHTPIRNRGPSSSPTPGTRCAHSHTPIRNGVHPSSPTPVAPGAMYRLLTPIRNGGWIPPLPWHRAMSRLLTPLSNGVHPSSPLLCTRSDVHVFTPYQNGVHPIHHSCLAPGTMITVFD
ncbi:hypothetical protein AVEN_267651-1 [Araneus ventricosus]|uniref:Uncharacterized protein n=1 Tax=Araneus ventricosus TaxID=182803 RepID=A0A4Y2PK63_ARAVE|nr:hypothetical protein AVEN_267651-1 [Araneus ventricosus]